MFFWRKKKPHQTIQTIQTNRPKKCERCHIEITDTEYTPVNGHLFCSDCAQLSPRCALDSRGCRFHFSYPADDMQAEDKYWDDEINRVHNRERNADPSEHPVIPEGVRLVDLIIIRTKEDSEYPCDPDFDWDTTLDIYTDDERKVYYFELQESFLSPWDAGPSCCGGHVTHEEAKGYLLRIGDHRYDRLFEE